MSHEIRIVPDGGVVEYKGRPYYLMMRHDVRDRGAMANEAEDRNSDFASSFHSPVAFQKLEKIKGHGMNRRALTIYFSILTSTFVFFFGFFRWHGNDVEFRYYTAIRMHACDIVKNDRSTLREFDPDKCSVRRRPLWVGELINVSCSAIGGDGREHQFSYSYSDVHLIFNYVFDHLDRTIRGGYCNG